MWIPSKDPDTGEMVVTTKKLKPRFYFQCREIEWETSKLNSVHDKDLMQSDLGDSTIKFYDASMTELTAGTQTELDNNCRYTKVTFAPSTDWGIRGVLIGQFETLAQDVYTYANMNILIDPAPVYLSMPQADGGLNMRFVPAHGHVGVDEDNFTYFTLNDYLEFIVYHPIGYNHRLQGKLKIAVPIPGA